MAKDALHNIDQCIPVQGMIQSEIYTIEHADKGQFGYTERKSILWIL